MLKSEEKLKRLAQVLDKGNSLLSREAIGLLREEPFFKGVIGLLVSVYNKTDDLPVKKAVEEFLNDLKDQAAVEEMMVELKKQLKPETISMLVSSCWQSGLDYSDYTIDFAGIFLKGDYVTAIECMTVIEESSHELDRERKDEVLELLEKNPISPGNEKAALKFELLSILER